MYRRFGDKDTIVHAVLIRESRRLIISIVITPSLRLRADDEASMERLVKQFMEPLLERQALPA